MRQRLVLARALLAAAAVAGAQTPDGSRLFQRCFACHSVDRTERHLSGPNLHGLFGRPAGTLDDFQYSPAMWEADRHGLVWREETLDRFLADPEQLVPGVRMAGVRLHDPGERRALIQWLKRATR
jgi:cytochrome c